MRALLLIALLSLAGAAPASETIATLVRMQGEVHVLPLKGFRKEPATEGQSLAVGQAVLTTADSSAVVEFGDGSRVALDSETRLALPGPEEWRQQGGKAYYRLESRNRRGRTVRTEFSVIGVKGTEFLVKDAADGRAVALAEGNVALESPEGRYKLYREKQRQAFEDYVQQQREAFQAYKERVQREFVGYARSFAMDSGRMATFSGNEATTGTISEDLQQDIQRLRDRL